MKKMNKYLEAIDTIGKIQEFEGASYYPLEVPIGFKLKYQKEFGILLELASKATPKKPKRKLIKNEDLWSETVTFIGIDICDNCKEHVQHSRKFCDKCGQALDWSNDE